MISESSSDRRERARGLVQVSVAGSLSEQVEKECQNKADDNACSDGKVESECVFFDQDVAGQLAKPRDLWRQDQ